MTQLFMLAQAAEGTDPSVGYMIRLAVVFVAVCVAFGVWTLAHITTNLIDKWKRNFLAEAEMEMEEMLMQVPAAKVLNYSMILGGLLALGAVLLSAAGEGPFNWKFALIAATVIFILTVIGSRFFLKLMKARRLAKFNDQLEEALMSMGNALKAGFSINQAVEMVIKQRKNPISLEFKLMIQQTQLGVSFDDALRNMAERVESEDFVLVSTSIITARQTGGDLTGVFARLAAVIRERLRIQRRIKTLTAQGRLQGMVLGSMPIVLLGILFFFIDPQLIKNFFTHPIGIVAFIIFCILEFCGFWTIKKIVTIDI